jgi:hypothetical protein
MAKQQSEDSVLISAARVVGKTLGRVKLLTTHETKASAKRAVAADSEGREQRQSPASPTSGAVKSSEPPRSRQTRSSGQTRKVIPITEEDEEDATVASPQTGASRSRRQTDPAGRGKSRSKRSKS